MATIAGSGAAATVVPAISVSNVTVQAGSAALFTVSLSAAPTDGSTVTMIYGTGGGTAQAGSAYTPTLGTLTFSGSQTSQTVSVPVAAGAPNGTFYFAVANPVNATIAQQLGMATIVNNSAAAARDTTTTSSSQTASTTQTTTAADTTTSTDTATTTTSATTSTTSSSSTFPVQSTTVGVAPVTSSSASSTSGLSVLHPAAVDTVLTEGF